MTMHVEQFASITIGIVTEPFTFEGYERRFQAEQGIAKLKEKVDTLITISNDRRLQIINKQSARIDAFNVIDDLLKQGVQGISDLIAVPSLINLDFADVKAIMSDTGLAFMGLGTGTGKNRAIMAAEAAIKSPLMQINRAKGVILNFTGDMGTTLFELNAAADIIANAADPEAVIIFGLTINENLKDEVQTTVIATGFDRKIP